LSAKSEREERKEQVFERVLERVLELEKQEVVQLRSYSTASASQQGIDSLPRSLPAQSDDEFSLII
jgi:hypothetical protein